MSVKTTPQTRDDASPATGSRTRRVARKFLVAPIRFYQLAISPFRVPTCRFYPTCSPYALIAIQRHGIFKGGFLSARRLGRCHPWNPGGADHAPKQGTGRST